MSAHPITRADDALLRRNLMERDETMARLQQKEDRFLDLRLRQLNREQRLTLRIHERESQLLRRALDQRRQLQKSTSNVSLRRTTTAPRQLRRSGASCPTLPSHKSPGGGLVARETSTSLPPILEEFRPFKTKTSKTPPGSRKLYEPVREPISAFASPMCARRRVKGNSGERPPVETSENELLLPVKRSKPLLLFPSLSI